MEETVSNRGSGKPFRDSVLISQIILETFNSFFFCLASPNGAAWMPM